MRVALLNNPSLAMRFMKETTGPTCGICGMTASLCSQEVAASLHATLFWSTVGSHIDLRSAVRAVRVASFLARFWRPRAFFPLGMARKRSNATSTNHFCPPNAYSHFCIHRFNAGQHLAHAIISRLGFTETHGPSSVHPPDRSAKHNSRPSRDAPHRTIFVQRKPWSPRTD